MNQPPEKFIEHLRSIHLSDTERETMRSSFLAKMRSGSIQQPKLSPWSWLLEARRFQAASLLVIIIIGYGSSAALAAEGALPGDVLYPVKIRMIEPIMRLVAANTPAAEANFETKLLNERLREAEVLDNKKALDAPLQESVREEIRKQGIRAKTVAHDVVEDETHGREAERALQNVLEEHKHILGKLDLSDERSDDSGSGKRKGAD